MKTKKTAHFLICLLVGFQLVSCEMSPSKLPIAQGNVGEVLIVMHEYLWNGACGDSVRHYFTEPVMGLPAAEPMFTLTQQSTLSNFMQKFRNIVIFNIDAGFENAKLGFKTDVYARNQLIFNIDAPSADLAIACAYENKDLITARFLLKDRDATIEDYQKIVVASITEALNEKFQVDIIIPKPYTLDVEKEDFVWVSREEAGKQWGILMWKEPYLRKTQLETDSLIFKMNAMTKKYVPGPSDGSYMADEPTVVPLVRRFEKNSVYSVQINGLWQTENSYMGGPYVNHTIVDTKRGQIVTGLGFVYYPNRDKRQMVRQLEAILHTMMPANDEKPAAEE